MIVPRGNLLNAKIAPASPLSIARSRYCTWGEMLDILFYFIYFFDKKKEKKKRIKEEIWRFSQVGFVFVSLRAGVEI